MGFYYRKVRENWPDRPISISSGATKIRKDNDQLSVTTIRIDPKMFERHFTAPHTLRARVRRLFRRHRAIGFDDGVLAAGNELPKGPVGQLFEANRVSCRRRLRRSSIGSKMRLV